MASVTTSRSDLGSAELTPGQIAILEDVAARTATYLQAWVPPTDRQALLVYFDPALRRRVEARL